MGWDKKQYQEVKKFAFNWMNTRPAHVDYKGTPESHIEFMLSQIAHFQKENMFEAAQGVKDAIIEFINQFPGEKISKDVLLKIPEWKPQPIIHCHISYAGNNPAGI